MKESGVMKNHTWLGITNERQENVYFLDYELRPLETMTISIWPDTSGYKSLGGVYINREPAEYRGGKECTCLLYTSGDVSQSGRIFKKIWRAHVDAGIHHRHYRNWIQR